MIWTGPLAGRKEVLTHWCIPAKWFGVYVLRTSSKSESVRRQCDIKISHRSWLLSSESSHDEKIYSQNSVTHCLRYLGQVYSCSMHLIKATQATCMNATTVLAAVHEKEQVQHFSYSHGILESDGLYLRFYNPDHDNTSHPIGFKVGTNRGTTWKPVADASRSVSTAILLIVSRVSTRVAARNLRFGQFKWL